MNIRTGTWIYSLWVCSERGQSTSNWRSLGGRDRSHLVPIVFLLHCHDMRINNELSTRIFSSLLPCCSTSVFELNPSQHGLLPYHSMLSCRPYTMSLFVVLISSCSHRYVDYFINHRNVESELTEIITTTGRRDNKRETLKDKEWEDNNHSHAHCAGISLNVKSHTAWSIKAVKRVSLYSRIMTVGRFCFVISIYYIWTYRSPSMLVCI